MIYADRDNIAVGYDTSRNIVELGEVTKKIYLGACRDDEPEKVMQRLLMVLYYALRDAEDIRIHT